MSGRRPAIATTGARLLAGPHGPRPAVRLRMRSFLILAVCAACDRPCEPSRLPDVPDAGPGEVRHGLLLPVGLGNDLDLATTSDGVACLTCNTIFYLDGALREDRRVAAGLAGSGTLAIGMTAIGGERTYVLDVDRGKDPDHGDDIYRLPNYQLFALSSPGGELGRTAPGEGGGGTGELAPLGPTAPRRAAASIAAGPAGVVVHGEPLGSLF